MCFKLLAFLFFTFGRLISSNGLCMSYKSTSDDLSIQCNNTGMEDFFYDISESLEQLDIGTVKTASLDISSSQFKHIYNFQIPPLIFDSNKVAKLRMDNSSVETIEAFAFKHFTQLTNLDLSSNRLSDTNFVKTLPDSITALTLKGNNLKYVPNVFSHMKHLRLLDFSQCAIHTFDFNILAFNSLSLHLDLSNNPLENLLCDSDGEVDLQYLLLSNTSLTNFCVPDQFTLSYHLNLSNRNNSDLGANFFQKISITHQRLKQLDLSNISLTEIPDKRLTNLHFANISLRLSFNKIKVLKNYTFNNSRMSRLDLSYNLIELIEPRVFSGAQISHELLLSNNKLTSLSRDIFDPLKDVKIIDLSNNLIKNLPNYLFSNCKELRILLLKHSGIESIRSKTFVGLPHLDILDLSNNSIHTFSLNVESKFAVLSLENNLISHVDLFTFVQVEAVFCKGNNIKTLLNIEKTYEQSSYITDLDLSASNIMKIERNAFLALTTLEKLNLSQNRIREIGSGTFKVLLLLKVLDLSGNDLVSLSPKAFEFGNSLKTLKISHFTSESNFITMNLLERLTISNTSVESIEPKTFKGLINLYYLSCSNVDVKEIKSGAFFGLTNIHDFDSKSLFKSIETVRKETFLGLKKLTLLDLSHLNINNIESKSFMGLCSLEALLLNHNRIVKVLNGTFSGLDHLKSLNLANNQITILEPGSFSGLTTLVELDLQNNLIKNLSFGSLQHFPFLRTLNLRHNHIKLLLTGFFSNLNHLEVLDLSRNNISRLEVDPLISLESLTFLNLNHNHIHNLQHRELANSLKHLKHIGLHGNKWRCNTLMPILMEFRNNSIEWISSEDPDYNDENIDGVACLNVCDYLYCNNLEENGNQYMIS